MQLTNHGRAPRRPKPVTAIGTKFTTTAVGRGARAFKQRMNPSIDGVESRRRRTEDRWAGARSSESGARLVASGARYGVETVVNVHLGPPRLLHGFMAATVDAALAAVRG